MEGIPKVETIRGLLENSGNQCAFPGCSHPVLNHRNQFIAKLAYLDPTIEPGQGYNRPENLMFLCYRHYVETRDSITYPLEILHSIKKNHESSSYVENTSRFQLKTISTIQESMSEQDTEDEQRDYLESAVTSKNEVVIIKPDEPVQEEIIEEVQLSPAEKSIQEDHIEEQISALAEQITESSNSTIEESIEDLEDVIQIPKNTRLEYVNNTRSNQPRKIGRIAFRNSDSKRLQSQLILLKKQVNELFEMMETLRKSDNNLNKDFKSLVASLDILGIFHHRFSRLPFRKNPFINRNHKEVHARVPKLKHALDSLLGTLENIAGVGGQSPVQNIKEDELPAADRPTTRILIKSIRYADQIAN